jgi:hypothetical protein
MIQRTGWLVATLGLALGCALFALACQDRPAIELIPVFPADDPHLLTRVGAVRLELKPDPVAGPDGVKPTNGGPLPTLVEQGKAFSLGLDNGFWQVVVKGVDAMDTQVVYGKTPRFEVARGKSGQVQFFLGRPMRFNLTELQPPEVAAALTGLTEHTATAFSDDEDHPWVLIAGGRQAENPDEPVASALLIDPLEFTVEQLPSLSCARSGHTGFAVQTAEGVRVVLAGGDDESGECRGSLDVFDPTAGVFQQLEPFPSEDREAVAVPEQVQEGTMFVDTGRVVVPGNPTRVVDLVSGAVEQGVKAEIGPDAPMYAAVTIIPGQNAPILVVTPNQLFVDEALHGKLDDCNRYNFQTDQQEWLHEATYGEIEEREGGELYSVSDGKFLFVGGLNPGGSEPEFGWSIISTRGCLIDEYGAGRRLPGPLPTHGFALIDLFPDDGFSLLATGGRQGSGGQSLDRVVLVTQQGPVSVPTWHDLSTGDHVHTMALRTPRAGHAAVQPGHDGSWWVLGGGDDPRPEIFLQGEGGMGPDMEFFGLRSPTMTSMTVLDTTPGTYDLNTAVAQTYPDELYELAPGFKTQLFLTARADRGISEGILFDVADSASCGEGASPGYDGVATGDVTNTELEQIIDVFPGEGQGQPAENSKNLATDLLQLIATYSLEVIPGLEQISGPGCSWRQLLTIGTEGLDRAGPSGQFDPGYDVTVGINVLVLVTSDDDCSQGFYGTAGTQPPAEVLAGHHDDYFGLPPGEDLTGDFAGIIGELVWDPADLIVAVVGNNGSAGNGTCTAGAFGQLGWPRRLLETVDALKELGVQSQPVELCGEYLKTPLRSQLRQLVELVEARNPLQACIPNGITDHLPEIDDERDLPVPPAADDQIIQDVADDAAARCWVVHKEDFDNPQYENVITWRGVAIDPSDWTVGVDIDTMDEFTCSSPWLVRAGALETSDGKDVTNAELICLP